VVYRLYAGGEWSRAPLAVACCPARANECHAVRNDFYAQWLGGGEIERLGAPVSEEGWQGMVLVRQDFERGWMEWTEAGGVVVRAK
jgi:hypothetical protein